MKETIEPMEPILFTNITERIAGNAKPSEFLKLMRYVAVDWDLDIRRKYSFDLAKKIVINSIKWN